MLLGLFLCVNTGLWTVYCCDTGVLRLDASPDTAVIHRELTQDLLKDPCPAHRTMATPSNWEVVGMNSIMF